MFVRELSTEREVAQAFTVMRELRPHLDEAGYEQAIAEQRRHGYRLAAVYDDEGRIMAVAGFRIDHKLAWGRHLYVDDLVTAAEYRSKGCGAALLSWLEDEARRNGCEQLHLDSGTARHGAHRFYLRHGLDISSFHFKKSIGS